MKNLLISTTVTVLCIFSLAVFYVCLFVDVGGAQETNVKDALLMHQPTRAYQFTPMSPMATNPGVSYIYGMIFTYQATQTNWWTGLAITNIYTGGGNQIDILVTDGTTGQITGEGTFYLPAFNAQNVNQLKTLITEGYVPQRGAIYVYGTGGFLASLLVGNNAGGFGIVDKEAIRF